MLLGQMKIMIGNHQFLMPEASETRKRREWNEANQRWEAFDPNTNVEYYWTPLQVGIRSNM